VAWEATWVAERAVARARRVGFMVAVGPWGVELDDGGRRWAWLRRKAVWFSYPLSLSLDRAASPPPFMDDSVDLCLVRGRRVLIWTVGRRHCA
jgi:hypothetical protein